MYAALVFVHGLLRWIVLLAALNAVVLAARSKEYTARDARAGLLLMIGLDTQVLVGLLLYALVSPLTHAAFANMGAAMKDPAVRFFVVEHPFAMLVALVAAHVGRVRVRRVDDARAKRKRALTWSVVALVALVVGVPWPGLPYARPLLPHF